MSEEIYISEEVNALVNEHYKPQSAHGIMVCERWAHAIQLLLNQQIQLACLNWKHRDAALQTKIASLEAEVWELRKDKERLDWLDYRKTNHYAHWSEDGWNGPFVSWSVSHVLMDGSYTFPNELIEMNVRSAIDAALNSTKGEK